MTIHAPPAVARADAPVPPRVGVVFALVTAAEYVAHVRPPENTPHPDHHFHVGSVGTELVVVAVVVLATGTVRMFVGRLP